MLVPGSGGKPCPHLHCFTHFFAAAARDSFQVIISISEEPSRARSSLCFLTMSDLCSSVRLDAGGSVVVGFGGGGGGGGRGGGGPIGGPIGGSGP